MTGEPDAGEAEGPLGDTIARLIEARAATAAAGNRRALFARMDGILATAEGTALRTAPSPASLHGGGTVRLRRMRLRNWKAFPRADLALPIGAGDADVILVGGANGFGKSSILEAYALGLFGRRAVSEAGFLLSAAASRGGQRRSYIELVRKALHRGEAAQSEGVCGVTLEFDTEEGPVEVQRMWYFDDAGSLIEDEEELLVRIGEERQLPAVPTGEDPQTWHQAEIERLVLPAAVAPFLMFDGEQVERWSERKLSDQVRTAVTRMLGLDQLTGLAADLKDYARDRGRGHGDADAAPRERLASQSEQLHAELTKTRETLHGVERDLADLRARRDALMAELTGGAGASHATLKELLEEEHRIGTQLGQARRELAGCIADHGPLVLAGRQLGQRVVGKVELIGKRAREAALDPAQLEGFWRRFLAAGPALDEGESDAAQARIVAAWGQDDGAAATLEPIYPHAPLDHSQRAEISWDHAVPR